MCHPNTVHQIEAQIEARPIMTKTLNHPEIRIGITKLNRISKSIACSLTTLVFLVTLTTSAFAEKTAYRARDFLYTVGAGFGTTGSDLDQARGCGAYGGFHVFRGGMGHTDEYLTLCKELDAKIVLFTFIGSVPKDKPHAAPSPAVVVAAAKPLAQAGVLLAVEGPNEPNNWPNFTYKGMTNTAKDWTALAHWTKDLYAAMKADPATKNIPILTCSALGGQANNTGMQYLTVPTPKPDGVLMPAGTKFADGYCSHGPYKDPGPWEAFQNTKQGDAYKDLHYVDWNELVGGPSLDQMASIPKVISEMYSFDSWGGKPSTIAGGNGDVKNYLGAFAGGYLGTCAYVLTINNGVHEDENLFDFVDDQYRPLAAATVIHNLTTILADPSKDFSPSQLGYTISGAPKTCHDLLMQKSTGEFELVIFDERGAGFTAFNLMVKLGGTHTNVKVFDVTTGTTPVQNLGSVNTVTLGMIDHPMIIEMDSNLDAK